MFDSASDSSLLGSLLSLVRYFSLVIFHITKRQSQLDSSINLAKCNVTVVVKSVMIFSSNQSMLIYRSS